MATLNKHQGVCSYNLIFLNLKLQMLQSHFTKRPTGRFIMDWGKTTG